MKASVVNREDWLNLIAQKFLWDRILDKGEKQPKHRISVGFPKGSRGGKGHSIGQCWDKVCSGDKTYEVFVSPELKDFDAVHVLAHELVHAKVGIKAKHGKAFKDVAIRMGLTGKMTATTPSDDFAREIRDMLKKAPEYPHAVLSPVRAKKPGSRLIKCICEGCGYTMRVTRQWIETATPICPNEAECDSFSEPMTVDD